MPQILLKNGTALIHESYDGGQVKAVQTDILIDGNKISQIGNNISASQAEVIDCTDKIISPGFVDTHHHTWQTQLKGRHANHTLLNYFPSGNFTSYTYTAEDAFWGHLGGCLEMINCGTTAMVDFAHINVSPEHNYNAVCGTVSSGIRSVYGFCPNPMASSINPFTIDPNGLGGHSMSTFEELAKQSPWGNSRVHLGLAWDGFPFTPKEYVDMLMARANEYQINLIQTHTTWKPGRPSSLQTIESMGHLDSRFLVAHSNMPKEDADLYRKRGVHYSSTPSTEHQCALAFPVMAFRQDLGVTDLGSLGVDCPSNNSCFIPGEARIGLQGARGARAKVAEDDGGKVPLTLGRFTVEEAFNLATIRGAHAMKRSDIGSIAEGKLADLVIFDALSPSMICGAQHDPVAAVILNSSPEDVEAVIIDGFVRKQGGRLVDVMLDDRGKQVAGKTMLQWNDVARALLKSRERIQSEVEKIDMKAAEKVVMEIFHINQDELVDPY